MWRQILTYFYPFNHARVFFIGFYSKAMSHLLLFLLFYIYIVMLLCVHERRFVDPTCIVVFFDNNFSPQK